MSNYKHPTSKSIAEDIFGKYKITGENGEDLGTMCDKVIKDPRFGWEKVEEPFKEGEWVYSPRTNYLMECLFRYKGKNCTSFTSGEFYILNRDGSFSNEGQSADSIGDVESAKSATPEQVERILSIVCRSKYKAGCKIKLKDYPERMILNEPIEFVYDAVVDSVYCRSGNQPYVYKKGTWAKIVEEPKAAEPEVEVEAGYEYDCINDLIRGTPRFTKGKRYLFKEHSEGMLETINDKGVAHVVDKDLMHKWFDMGQDWKKKPVFSYEDLEKYTTKHYILNDTKVVIVSNVLLEEEAKKRSKL